MSGSFGEMLDHVLPDPDDALLRATAGLCDTGYAWVATAIASGAADVTPEDLQELEAALKRPSRKPDIIGRLSTEIRTRLDRLVSSSIHIHEETHFYQLISTPYGRLASEIERYWLADLVELARELAATGAIDPRSLAVRTWVEQNLAPSSPNYILARYAELAYTQTHAIKSCFSGATFKGFQGHEVPDLTIGDALNSWPDFLCAQDRAEAAVETLDLRIQQISHPSALTTHLREDLSAVPALEGMTVAPRDIFEGVALEIQLAWVRSQLRDEKSLPQALRLLNSGFIDKRYLTTRRLVAKLLPDVAWPARRSLLLTLSDLALWGPTHRDYLDGNDYEVPWEDLHPGYRFVRALDVVVKKRRDLSDANLHEPLVVTELVCDELRWRTPVQMAESYLQAGSVDNASSRVGRDALRDYRLRAAKARLTEPAVFIDGTNEEEIHEQFQLVMPFIVERGRLRIKEEDLTKRSEILFLSTLAHIVKGLFEGKLSRLFNEPSSVSDIVHTSVLEAIFDDKTTEFSELLTDVGAHAASELAFELAAQPGQLDEFIQRLSREGLDDYSRVVRQLRVYAKDAALDWFVRQPAIVEAVLGLREEIRPDGSFTIKWPVLYSVLSKAIASSKVEYLKELFEDCGYHYFNREIEFLPLWSGGRTPASPEPGLDEG